MFTRSFPRSSHRSLGLLLPLFVGALTAACGGAPSASDSGAAAYGGTSADSTLAPSSCHGAASAEGVVGVSCDAFSTLATSYTLERLEGGAWISIDGPVSNTPDLSVDLSSFPESSPPPEYPLHVRIRASAPEGDVFSDPIDVPASL